ncbi:unnamed protein product [Periconia digitata]|uniref:Cytochrome P450 n=1 Tax=Periconia digitata TaxID=1303443 RepID=A0A9W4URJ6_9PLEO|nr:unnamed protein product [Periconia digitata]
MFLLLLTAVVTICAGDYILRALRLRRAEQLIAVAHSCKTPARLDTGRWPLGLELIVTAFRAAGQQRLLELMSLIVEKTGSTFEQKLLGSRGIDTVAPSNVEAILSTKFTDFGLGERRLVFAPLLGDGIFTQDGHAWAQSRALLKPAFRHNDSVMAQIAEATEELICRIPEGSLVDLQPLFFRFTLDTTSYLLFGHRLGGLESDLSEKFASFSAAFDRAQDCLARRGRLGPLYWLIDGPQFRKDCARVHEHIDGAIEKALQKSNSLDQEATYTILGALIKETQDPKVLREQCLNVLLAGRDTTACLLSWTFRLLARNPTVFDRCRKEVMEICSEREQLTRQQLERMKFVDAVLKEVLRLYPSVPINSRVANCTTVLPTGGGTDGKAPVLVRKGEAVGYCPYIMHRREDVFGSDANIFRPDRWLENEGRLFSSAGYGYIPFNAGQRICLGQRFAMLEASYVVASILLKFSSLEIPADQPVESIGTEQQKLTLVLCSADGCRVILR